MHEVRSAAGLGKIASSLLNCRVIRISFTDSDHNADKKPQQGGVQAKSANIYRLFLGCVAG